MNALQIIAIAVGGALGAILRAAVGLWIPAGFPWATLLVNVAGSFIIGLVLGLETTHLHNHPHLRLFLTTGFCGALTTFSTFSYQTLSLLNSGEYIPAALNITLNLLLTLGAVWLGLKVAVWAF